MKLLQESPVEFLEPLSLPPETIYVTEVKGKFGTIVMSGTAEALLHLHLYMPLSQLSSQIRTNWGSEIIYDNSPFSSICEGIKKYLEGNPEPISAKVQPVMLKPFTVNVHRYLTRIPFGETYLYSEIAVEMGNPGAARAVGGACSRNSVLIIVPCHRVVAVDGLGGFGAGLDLKKRLLEHESIILNDRKRITRL